MIKKLLAAVLALSITTGVPVGHMDCMQGKAINHYKENGIKYTAFATSDGNMWITEGIYKGRYYIVFDDKGTKAIEDDEIIKLIKK
nr:MAG TPA: hypothetical protein [Caudoviricetes sp.]